MLKESEHDCRALSKEYGQCMFENQIPNDFQGGGLMTSVGEWTAGCVIASCTILAWVGIKVKFLHYQQSIFNQPSVHVLWSSTFF